MTFIKARTDFLTFINQFSSLDSLTPQVLYFETDPIPTDANHWMRINFNLQSGGIAGLGTRRYRQEGLCVVQVFSEIRIEKEIHLGLVNRLYREMKGFTSTQVQNLSILDLGIDEQRPLLHSNISFDFVIFDE